MGKVIKMRKMFFLILTAMTLLTTSCGKKTDIDFGKGKYKEPFRGVLSSRPKWLEATLNWPVLRGMKPDTVTLTKNVKIKFYKSAVKSGSYATLRFTDKNNKLPQYVTIYCDGKPVKDGVCKIKANSRKKHVEIKFKIDPRIGNASVSGKIYNPGGEVKKINGHRTPKNSKYAAATWSFRHKIGRPFALWSVWYSIFIVIVVAVAIILIIMTIRVLKMPSEIIEHKLRKNTLPIKGGHLFMNKGVSKEVKKELAVLNEIKNRHFDSEEQRMMAISDQHLKMFYKFVIPSRASKDVQKTMTKLLAESRNCTDMTCLKMPNLVCKFKANPADAETIFKSTLAIYEMNLEKSKKILKNWEADFFDFDKNHKQAENLAMVVKNIDGQCIKPAHSFTQNLIDQLDNLRSIAFCNIRLGVELANLIRPQTFTNEGKQTLATDKMDDNLVSVDHIGDVLIDIKKSHEKAEDGAYLWMMASILSGGFFFISGVVHEAHKMLEQGKRLNRYKAEMTKYITRSGDYINKCNAVSMRCIEIGNALVEMNKGFWAVYEPIARKFYIDKTFQPGTSAAAKDYSLLRSALNEYNKLNKVEL